MVAHRQGTARVIVVRPFNLVGPGLPRGLAAADFLEQIRAIRSGGGPSGMTVGNLEPQRDFVDVRDVVAAYLRLADRPELAGGTFNIAITDLVTLETSLITQGGSSDESPFYSPDGRKLAWVDQSMTIRLFDVESRKLTKVDQGLFMFEGALRGFRVDWSADGRWFAYSRNLESRQSAIFLYDTQEGERHQATSGFYSDLLPAFDPDGKYLYFVTNRTFGPSYSDIDNSWIYANSSNIVAAPLRRLSATTHMSMPRG